MALFDTYAPLRPAYYQPRTFNAGFGTRLKLGLTGSNTDGSQNWWGKTANYLLPVGLGAVAGYFTYGAGTGLGVAAGNLANKGLNSASRNILAGTDASITDQEVTNKEDRDDALVSTIGSLAGSVAGSIHSSLDSINADKALEGVSDQSISDYLYDEAGTEYGNMAQSLMRSNNVNTSPLLDNLFGSNNNNNANQMSWSALSNSLLAATQPLPTAAQPGYTMPVQPMQNSSILPNPDANSNVTYLQDRKRVTDPYAMDTESPYRYLNGFADGGEVLPFKYFDGGAVIYPDADKKSEDLFMVDKKTAKLFGVDGILGKISLGEARYGERIFDQQSNLIQKSIMKSNMSADAKKAALGEHIFEEIKTHKDFSGGKSGTETDNFAKGGVITPAEVKPQVSAFQAQYNQWARANKLKPIKVDGLFGPETQGAIEKWNASNPEKYKFDVNTTQTSRTGSPINTLSGIQLLSADTPAAATPNTDATIDTNLPEAFAGIQSQLQSGTAPIAPNTTVASAPTNQTPVLTQAQRDNLFGNIADLAGAGVGAIIGSQGLPRYQPTEEYTRMLGDVYARKNEGLSAEERSAINQGLTNNYAAAVNTIRNVSGGGGTQGAVLGALGNASSNLNDAYLSTALQDVVQRRNNYGRYQNAVMNDLALDQNIFAQDQQAALASQQAGLTLMDRSLQNIADRRQFNEQYGQGSAYSNLLNSFAQGTEQQDSRSTGLVDMYRRLLENQAKPTTIL